MPQVTAPLPGTHSLSQPTAGPTCPGGSSDGELGGTLEPAAPHPHLTDEGSEVQEAEMTQFSGSRVGRKPRATGPSLEPAVSSSASLPLPPRGPTSHLHPPSLGDGTAPWSSIHAPAPPWASPLTSLGFSFVPYTIVHTPGGEGTQKQFTECNVLQRGPACTR